MQPGAQRGKRALCRARKRLLQPRAQCIPIGLAIQHEAVHPSVASGQHAGELLFQSRPVVVAPQQQRFQRLAQLRVVAINARQRAPRRATIQFVRLARNVQLAAQLRHQGLLQCQLAAERVNGVDAQLRGQLQQIPAKCTRARQHTLRDGGWFSLSQLVQNAIAHLRGGCFGKGDGDYFAGLVHQLEQRKESLGE